MKYRTVSLSALVITSFTANMTSAGDEGEASTSLSEALQNGETSVESRVFYFNRDFDKPGVRDAEALTAGGIMKYESGNFNRFKLGLAYYGSHSLFNIIDRDKGGGTSILQSNGDDIAFLGEAYIDYNVGNNQIKLGRQRLTTPLMDDHDLRLLPSTYEAAVYLFIVTKAFQTPL